MADLNVSEELHAAITDLAAAERMSVEEYLKRALRTIRFLQKTWCTEYSEEDAAPQEAAAPQPEVVDATPWVKVGDTLIKNKKIRSLYLEFIGHVGCRKIFDAYPEAARQLIFNHQPKDVKPEFYTKMDDGRYHFWVYHVLSTGGARRFMSTAATALNIDLQMWQD